MLILLPPSEGKSSARRGTPFRWDELLFPELNEARRAVLAGLQKASDAPDAHAVLGVGASLAGDIRRNLLLGTAPASGAHSIYSGVLYEALGYATLTPAQKRKARSQCIVVSGLWGAIGLGDRIPAYRLSMAVDLPGIGRLTTFWKQQLAAPLTRHAGHDLVVDCRSSTYAAAWTPPPQNSAAVNVFALRGGRRTVVSHFAKHTRGELARHLLTRRGAPPATPAALLAATQEKWTADLTPATARKPAQLNILVE
ncbi:peroxide stress protein YaaA [Arthrobacter echini]|uniref:Peroxide stress protein YaaA n=1 Tax=Arthrobacter echini TaxID=1529066 RepID=A0A4S5E6A2_9MICC|nr:peroxide stress protein YaaA [Arthrobacter echini]THJ66982.1 peroxide stress protein YaaA [Arthrobacter echini]